MCTKDEYKVIDNFQIEFLDNNAEREIYYVFQKLQGEGKIKIKSLLLPAPLEVLINEYDNKFNVEYRDVMGPSQGRNKSIEIFKDYTKLLNDSSLAENELYITDRYLFSDTSADYLKLIIEILSEIKIKNINFVIPKGFGGFKIQAYEYVKEKLLIIGINVQLLSSDKFHDRFWISNKCGFVSGTSLNGIVKITSLIQLLNPLDYLEIYKEIKKI